MVLYNPMEQPMLQLVISHPATDKVLFPRRAPPWVGDLRALSDAQLRSVHAFAQYAINNLRGETGTSSFNGNMVSNAAIEVANNYPHTGVGAFGGNPERRRERRQRSAERTVEQIESIAQERQVNLGASRR